MFMVCLSKVITLMWGAISSGLDYKNFGLSLNILKESSLPFTALKQHFILRHVNTFNKTFISFRSQLRVETRV